ncbi:hypothetical protein AXK11_08500 [Cephaloticoccus primus]|uniref:Uncharacterized protein n=1 Tax=Cephaloticoccus primus TaxID=1548207 RepID=A0A139SIM3_9BACT|nr:hypothetical protein [Cephaloticoccus primus]KXU34383.1 hypothetical protein AXK11_08500 [Cephaloticoccus primus]
MRRALATLGLLCAAVLHANASAGGVAFAGAAAVTADAAARAVATQPRAEPAASPARTEKPPAPAPVRVLEAGLGYLRAAQGAGSALAFPDAALSSHAALAGFVLDLRYAAGSEREAARLGAWLAEWAETDSAPVFFILVNAETAPALSLAAAQFAQTHAALLIGPAGGAVSPDIVLPIDPEQERAAYAAFATGEAAPAVLIGEAAAANKPRYDEAAVIAAHTDPAKNAPGDNVSSVADASRHGSRRHAPRKGATQSPRPSTDSSAEDGGASPIDLSLQRAIHLHRAWRALKLHP